MCKVLRQDRRAPGSDPPRGAPPFSRLHELRFFDRVPIAAQESRPTPISTSSSSKTAETLSVPPQSRRTNTGTPRSETDRIQRPARGCRRHACATRTSSGPFRGRQTGSLREAGNGARTRDPQLGKLMLYQLSYSRVGRILAAQDPARNGVSTAYRQGATTELRRIEGGAAAIAIRRRPSPVTFRQAPARPRRPR